MGFHIFFSDQIELCSIQPNGDRANAKVHEEESQLIVNRSQGPPILRQQDSEDFKENLVENEEGATLHQNENSEIPKMDSETKQASSIFFEILL